MFYRELASAIVEHDLQPIQEKVYGRADARGEVLAARHAALCEVGLDPERLPCTYHDGRLVDGTGFAGAQLWGIIAPDDGAIRIETVDGAPDASPGRSWTGPGYRFVYIPGVRGTSSGVLADGVGAQAERMLLNADAALEAHGLTFQNVTRTWIYLGRILDWYGEFNRVRTAFFRDRGVGVAPRVFPASTGIQASTNGEECSMDLLALEAEPDAGVDVQPLERTGRQESAFDYGSAFSRAVSMEVGGGQTVYVSGTASIDAAGNTLYVGNPEAQILETLLNVAALLHSRGGGLSDICTATLFCKNAEVLSHYHRVTRLLGMPDLPVVPVIADVCRHELLVEIEAIAALPRGAKVPEPTSFRA